MNSKVSLFGKGFVGSEYFRQFPSTTLIQDRDNHIPITNKILYGISTIDNYNLFENPYLDVETNLLLLIKVLENARVCFGEDVEFNFISSWFVYGSVMLPAHEDSQCNPKGFYSITKRAAEELLISYCISYNMKFRILRLANVLGVGDDKVSARKNATQWLMHKISNNEPIKIYYGGDFFRDYIDVRDCAKAINLVIEDSNYNSIYNIGNGIPIKFKDVIDLSVKLSKSESKIEDFVDTDFHEQVQVKSMYLSNDKLDGLGYKPKYTIEKTIKWIMNDYIKS